MSLALSGTVLCKAAGSAAIFAAIGASAYVTALRDKARLRRLDSLIALIVLIRDQIDRYLTPVSEILRRCDPEVIDGCFIGCSADETEKERQIPTDIRGLVDAIAEGEFFSDGKDALVGFAADFGRSFREEELRSCDACLESLRQTRSRLMEELPKERRSRTVLCFCIAAAIIIILI
ncbi:MAG: hypothetical protein MJ102_01095 [Clostridia bacterium]|nr:hypothetical protein [Clostridia bacterium]